MGKSTTEQREYARKWYAKNREQRNQQMRAYRLKLKQEMVSAYGSVCACCGESRVEFLSIDHINGGGSKFHGWLRRQGYPKDQFRILCYNCNMALGHLGYCPLDFESAGHPIGEEFLFVRIVDSRLGIVNGHLDMEAQE